MVAFFLLISDLDNHI